MRELKLSLRPEKTFMGRSSKGFDLLGYYISPEGFSLSSKTQEKALKAAKQHYVQGGKTSLLSYLKRWRTWVHAGLPFKVNNVEEVVESITTHVCFSCPRAIFTESEPYKRPLPKGLPPTSPYVLICSERGEDHFNQKGDLTCKSNFFRHYY